MPKSLLGNPGPGSYQVGSTLTAEGKYTLSKIRNPPVHSFNPPHNSSAFSKGFITTFDLLLFLLKIQKILDQDIILWKPTSIAWEVISLPNIDHIMHLPSQTALEQNQQFDMQPKVWFSLFFVGVCCNLFEFLKIIFLKYNYTFLLL